MSSDNTEQPATPKPEEPVERQDKPDEAASSSGGAESGSPPVEESRPAQDSEPSADKPSEQESRSTPASDGLSPAAESKADDEKGRGHASQAAPVAKPRGAGLALFLSVLALTMAGAGGAWLWWQEQQRAGQPLPQTSSPSGDQFERVQGSLNALEQRASRLEEAMASQGEQLTRRLAEYNQQIERSLDTAREQIARLGEQQQASAETANRLAQQVSRLGQRLDNRSADGEQQWRLNEVETLLRMSQQQLIVSRDVRTAQSLLLAADDVLKGLDDSQLHAVREALAADLSALRAVPEIDIQGRHASLSALARRVQDLPVRQGGQEQLATAETVTLGDTREEASALDRLLGQLSSLVSVKRMDQPMQGMLNDEQAFLLRQHIVLQIEQAQLALVRADAVLYRSSLAEAIAGLQRYFRAEEGDYQSIVTMLAELGDEDVSVTLPPANSALMTLQGLIDTYQRRLR